MHARYAMTGWIRLLAASLVFSQACVGMVRAQDAYPSRPVHILVPFAPGGAVDIVARTLGDELSSRWGRGCKIIFIFSASRARS